MAWLLPINIRIYRAVSNYLELGRRQSLPKPANITQYVSGNDIEYHATVGWPNKQGVLATRTVAEFEFYKNKVPADIMQR